MKNNLIIHGHFYQPPREDPWLGLVPYQESAYPYHDWNQRITKECYAANTMSRVLDPEGRITDLINNFEYISFNFGPTLLNWLRSNHPQIHERIRQADEKSMKTNNGHGNAIAQCYNHTILPLSDREDIRTQVIWGIKDFESHFSRPPEGMWLAETAINNEVVDVLIGEGIRFVILSPWQAEAICPVGSDKWQSYENSPVPSGRAYRIDRDKGSLNVFFYNHVLAHGISFEHYLRDANALYEKFISFRQSADKTYLLNAATDGEIYGHHEPFGDMCLAAFSKLVQTRNDFTFTNYGHYLEQFPPTYLVRLRKGENETGTSWSCVHGVARWYRDCGCTTGSQKGWNQEWRTPLRNAFNFLNTDFIEIYKTEMAKISGKDPFRIRERYIDVMTGTLPRDDFFKEVADKADPADHSTAERFFTLLEGQKYAQFMFTSCAWFFSEISGLEATQNMKYAVKALDLYSRWSRENILSRFLSELENARSNITEFGSGRNIMETWIIPGKKGNEYGAAIFVLSELCMDMEENEEQYGIFRKESFKMESQTEKDGFLEKTGLVSVQDLTRNKRNSYRYRFQENDLEGFFLTLSEEQPGGKSVTPHTVPIGELPLELRTRISEILSARVVDKCIGDTEEPFINTNNALAYVKRLNVGNTPGLRALAELLINRSFEKILNNPKLTVTEEDLGRIRELVTASLEYGLNVNTEGIRKKISGIIAHQARQLTAAIPEEPVKAIVHFLETSRSLKIEPETTEIQEVVFNILKSLSAYSIKHIEESQDFQKLNQMRRLIKLGTVLGINVEKQKEEFFSL